MLERDSMSEEMDHVAPASFATVVAASDVNILVAQSRAQDTEYLQKKESAFFALFRKPEEERGKTNPRIAQSTWGDVNPLFVSKLLVNCNPYSHLLPLPSPRSILPPSTSTTKDKFKTKKTGQLWEACACGAR